MEMKILIIDGTRFLGRGLVHRSAAHNVMAPT
jgi:hypothetical protein